MTKKKPKRKSKDFDVGAWHSHMQRVINTAYGNAKKVDRIIENYYQRKSGLGFDGFFHSTWIAIGIGWILIIVQLFLIIFTNWNINPAFFIGYWISIFIIQLIFYFSAIRKMGRLWRETMWRLDLI